MTSLSQERPVHALFQGFGLGIWKWPIVNLLLGFSQGSRSSGLRQNTAASRSLTPTVSNTEKWSWIDYQGRKRVLVVERQVKELG